MKAERIFGNHVRYTLYLRLHVKTNYLYKVKGVTGACVSCNMNEREGSLGKKALLACFFDTTKLACKRYAGKATATGNEASSRQGGE